MSDKRCSSCLIILDVSEFSRNRSRSDGLQSRCKKCVRSHYLENRESILCAQKKYVEENRASINEKKRLHYAENRERILEDNRGWRERNPDKVSKSVREYRLRNPDKVRVWSARYREKNADFIREKGQSWRDRNRIKVRSIQKRYVREHPDKVAESRRRYQKTERFRITQSMYKKSPRGRMAAVRSSSNRRLLSRLAKNDLTIEQWDMILKKQGNRCASCGVRFGSKVKPTRDHIVPVSKGGGLTVDNVVALCSKCNSSKGDRDPEYVAQRGLL